MFYFYVKQVSSTKKENSSSLLWIMCLRVGIYECFSTQGKRVNSAFVANVAVKEAGTSLTYDHLKIDDYSDARVTTEFLEMITIV